MFKHKKCCSCEKVFHKTDMVLHDCTGYAVWYCEKCYEKRMFMRKCECGKGWVSKIDLSNIKLPKGGTVAVKPSTEEKLAE